MQTSLVFSCPSRPLPAGRRFPAGLGDRVAHLPQAERKRYQALLQAFEGMTVRLGRQDVPLTEVLASLLDRMPPPDHQGTTLLEHLSQVLQEPGHSESERRELAAELLVHAAEPQRFFRQLHGKGTCGATAPAFCFLRDHPTEFVRVFRDLYAGRAARLPNGDHARVPKGALRNLNDRSGNTRVERVVQAAFMRYATGAYYDLEHDVVVSHQGTRRGLLPQEIARLLTALNNQKYDSWTPGPGVSRYQLARMLAPLSKATRGPVLASLAWPGEGYHAIQISRVEGSVVLYRNPWGQPQGHRLSSRHEELQYGMERLPLGEFTERVACLFYPSGARGMPPSTMPEPPRPGTLPEMPARPWTVPEPPPRPRGEFWVVGDRHEAQRFPSLRDLAVAIREEGFAPGSDGIPVTRFEDGRPLPLRKTLARTALGAGVGAVATAVGCSLLGVPASPLLCAVGAAAVGTLALSACRAAVAPREVEDGRLCENRQGQLVYRKQD
ncbi:MAG: hypothetical protein AB1758_27045 [Candidatus Eremiobacterota bacterium]